MIFILIINCDLQDVMDISNVTSNLESNLDDFYQILQAKYFLPDWSQSLVFGVSLKSIIDHLNYSKRITFASKISRMETLTFYDLYNKVSNILHVVKCVCKSLKIRVWILDEGKIILFLTYFSCNSSSNLV